MEKTAAAEGDFYPNEYVQPFNAEWNFLWVVKLGIGDGGIDVQMGNEGDDPYSGIADVAQMAIGDRPDISYQAVGGPGLSHIPEGSVIERFKWQMIPLAQGGGMRPVTVGLWNVTANGVEPVPTAA